MCRLLITVASLELDASCHFKFVIFQFDPSNIHSNINVNVFAHTSANLDISSGLWVSVARWMGGWQISKVWNSNSRWGCYFDPQGIHHYMFRHETSPVWPSKRCHYRKLYGWCYYDPQGIHHYIYFITRHVLCELQKYFQKLYRRCCSDSQSIHHYIFLHAISLVWPSRRYHYRKLYGWSYFDPIGIQHYIFHHATSLVCPLIRCHCCKHFIILKMSTEYTLEPENTRAMQNVSYHLCIFVRL